ncbi:sodium/proton antiporter, CPA1 family [Tistlia consotensis]|uniref:Sodium/proton antiporter, CPA1 family n=1 Tax=Tistlia consotensis USBA 355 TaxID=560819 RepID=A0A1Y6B2Z7_9PROT|nr:cation:proton antiporter [Tistlia consotensis]SME88853.1 sodium/proton antiporter, CPA1 family [Tistlia consotensis USBA 355]SNR25402.1 sodium/proton antiporter, CPA1 family [Tistlia consotensis]
MTELVPILLALIALLTGVSLLAPLSERVRLPFAALLAGLGILLGLADVLLHLLGLGWPAGGRFAVIDNLFDGLRVIGLGADGYLYLFLPPLLFAAALEVDVRLLLDEVAAVLLLAVVAVAVSAGAIGFALYEASERGLVVCLLLGAIVATTDPAGVIAIFRDLGAPRRLTVLVAGESLFNDAAAIALFALLLTMLTLGLEPHPMAAATAFLIDFVGGLGLGFLLARLSCLLLAYLRDMPIAAITLSVALAYLAFILGENYLGVSGVVAVVTAGLVISVEGPLRISPGSWSHLAQTWQQLDFWATSLVFVLASMLGVQLLKDMTWNELGLLGVLVVAALAARALVLEGLFPLLVLTGLARPLGRKTRFVMLWGGLRGAATLVLALSVVDSPALSDEVRRFVGVLATGYVFFTLFVNGTTLRPLIGWLKLDRLSPTERALRDRVMALSGQAIRRQVAETAESYGFDSALADGLGPPDPPPGDALRVSPEQRLEVGLRTLANREKELYLQHFQDRSLSRGLVGRLVALADRLLDAVKIEGAEGYRRAGTRPVLLTGRLRFAPAVQRLTGWSTPLAEALADRFELLLAVQLVLRELESYNRQSLGPLLGNAVRDALAGLIEARRTAVDDALAAVDLQYPGFARALRRQYLARAALRLEESAYRHQLEESVIGREVFADLMADLERRRRALDRRPSLDLGLRLMEMVRRVPLFRQADTRGLAELGQMLRARLAYPGERIVARGATGRSMYFIASGAVEVHLDDRSVLLGPGEFFGELALLTRQPRNADVVASGYCHLLELEARDFRRLMRRHPGLRQQIERIASERRNGAPAPEPQPDIAS